MKDLKRVWIVVSMLVFIGAISFTAVFGQDDQDEPVVLPDIDSPQGIDAIADQQILDDLIVDGSACIGVDCVNGESFGFDTIRLKENNLRIKFYDTSTSASFPSNDWQITINDSTNGGQNYFAVEDVTAGRIPFRILADAPANALFVNAQGDVGLGTAMPATTLHLNDQNTPIIRLEQNGTSGWTPQTWDVGANESFFFIRDVTNSLNQPVKIQTGAPEESLYVAADGSVTMGGGNFYLDAAGNLTIPGILTTGSGTYSATAQNDALLAQIEAQQSEIDKLQQENGELAARLAELELLVQSIVETSNQ